MPTIQFLLVSTEIIQGETKMAKKKPKSKPVRSKIQDKFLTKSPRETDRSRGCYYVRKLKSGKWNLYFESWKNGEKKQELIPVSEYINLFLPIQVSMTVEQARKAMKDHNFHRKNAIGPLAQIRAMKRVDLIKKFDKSLFPPDLVELFIDKVRKESDGTEQHKLKLIVHFNFVQKMIRELSILPHEYKDNYGYIVDYFKTKKLSVSYSKNLINIMNRWGYFISRQQGKYYEPIKRLKGTTKSAIKSIQKAKADPVRRPSLPMTELLLAKIKRKVSKSDQKQLGWLNFIIVSFYFGLRPKEVMTVVEKPIVENHNGIPVLVVNQTKLTSVSNEEDRIKKIPVICEQQMTALGLIKTGHILRPHSSWVDQLCKEPKIVYGPTEDYGLYTGRKGFTDLMLTLGQNLEDISGWLGHHSIDMTWKFYKTKNVINFNQTDFVKKNFKRPKSKPKKVS